MAITIRIKWLLLPGAISRNMNTPAAMTTPAISVAKGELPSTLELTSAKRFTAIGHTIYACGLIGIGILSLGSGDFAFSWQPVPEWVPGRTGLAYLSGIVLIVFGIGLVIRRSARLAALGMAAYQTVLLVALHLTRVLYAPADVGRWLGLAENMALVCGGWILAISITAVTATPGSRWYCKVRVPQFLFAASCVVFGLSHFVYVQVTAGMVPAWLPYHLGFAYLTGSGHLAAGLAILFMIIPAIAGTLEAGMISTFVLLLHIPGVLSDPHSRLQWTMLCQASALAGSAWLIAASLQKKKSGSES